MIRIRKRILREVRAELGDDELMTGSPFSCVLTYLTHENCAGTDMPVRVGGYLREGG